MHDPERRIIPSRLLMDDPPALLGLLDEKGEEFLAALLELLDADPRPGSLLLVLLKPGPSALQ
jgi:hypothetical protein